MTFFIHYIMCGRFAFSPFQKLIEERFDIEVETGNYIPRYNCAPSQSLAVITNNDPDKLSYFKWGLIPHWAKDPKIGYKLINARAETIDEKASFKSSFLSKRCLIPADSFYEWKVEKNKKIPYRIFIKNESIFTMAGIWDIWRSPQENLISSFSIITTSANDFMSNIHDRMPVILNRDDEKKWLANEPAESLKSFLKQYPSELMDAYEVSSMVNNPINDNAEISKRII